jgi:hypothetical protein
VWTLTVDFGVPAAPILQTDTVLISAAPTLLFRPPRQD